MDRVARDPSAVPTTRCDARVFTPGRVEVQVNRSPSTRSETVHTVAGSRGCLMRTREPTCSGSGLDGRIEVIDAVHVGQDSTSERTAHTTSGGALMSTVTSTRMTAPPGLWGRGAAYGSPSRPLRLPG